MGPEDTLKQYEKRINRHRFDEVEPLLSEHAVFWFNDGSYCGKTEIRNAFEKTWKTLNNDSYWLTNLNWLSEGDNAAVCLYDFNWKTEIDGKMYTGNGRGTSVLRKEDGQWRILHEHLSSHPAKTT